jgi:hypothetical protein
MAREILSVLPTVVAVLLSVLAADKVYSTMVPVAHARSLQQLVPCATDPGSTYQNNRCMPVIVGK